MSYISKLQKEDADDIREHYHEGGAIALLLPESGLPSNVSGGSDKKHEKILERHPFNSSRSGSSELGVLRETSPLGSVEI
jgi:hypothetical protein